MALFYTTKWAICGKVSKPAEFAPGANSAGTTWRNHNYRLNVRLVTGLTSGYTHSMKTVPLSEAKDKLSALVEEADKTHEIIQITRHGHPSAVLMSADDLESLQETIHWLSQPGIREDLDQARRDIAEGNTVSGDDLRREFGLPPK